MKNDLIASFDRKIPLQLLNQYYLDWKIGLMFCHVPKAACTYFGKILIELHGYNESYTRDKEFIHLFLKNITTQYSSFRRFLSRKINLNKMPKILFVRHPFSRLLSGYLDKIYNKIETIPVDVQNYQKFLHKMILSLNLCKNKSESCLIKNANISFPIFVDSLIAGLYDIHFLPYTKMCMPCSIPYTHIIRQETFSEDINCLLRDLGISEFNNDALWVSKQYPGERTDKYLKEFYSQLSTNQIQQLVNYTFLDHVLFYYKFKQYF